MSRTIKIAYCGECNEAIDLSDKSFVDCYSYCNDCGILLCEGCTNIYRNEAYCEDCLELTQEFSEDEDM